MAKETALARTQEQFEFTPEQRQMIRDTFASGANDAEFAVLMEVARARRLNPITRQVHFVKRWDSQKQREVWSTQISIDGLRAVADRTGEYDGQDEPEFIYEEKRLVCAKVRVWRKGIPRAFVGVAHFSEYVQKKKDGTPTQFWREKPHVMLAKCAEALGIRKGFPEDTSGLYVPEEMGQADNEIVVAEVIDRETGEITKQIAAPTPTQVVKAPAPTAPNQVFDDLKTRFEGMSTEDDAKVLEGEAKKAAADRKISREDLLRLSGVCAARKRWLRGEMEKATAAVPNTTNAEAAS